MALQMKKASRRTVPVILLLVFGFALYQTNLAHDENSDIFVKLNAGPDDLCAKLQSTEEEGIPKWPSKSAEEKTKDAQLRQDLLAGKFGPLKPDMKPEPPDWVADYSHMDRCTSCFEPKHKRSVHSLSHGGVGVGTPGRPEIVGLDDHALQSWHGLVRVLSRPSKKVTDLACPGPRCRGGNKEHLEKNHFGMYGSVLYEAGNFRIWLGNGVPYYSSSSDGLHWDPLEPLAPWNGYFHMQTGAKGGVTAPDSSASVPRNLCVTRDGPRHEGIAPSDSVHKYKMGFHCGNHTGWESTCLAHSPDGLLWTPYDNKRHCGTACKWAADTTNCLFWHPGTRGEGDAIENKSGYRLINRRNYGTTSAWRDIRGVRISVDAGEAGHSKFESAVEKEGLNRFEEISSWYFDRLGKSERFQRQMYSLSVSTDLYASTGIHLGIATVIEWPKVPNPTTGPPWKRDVTAIYLLPTRDGGETFDLGWVYEGSELIPRGDCSGNETRCEFDHGYLQAASELVTVNDTHWLFYEGREVRHEDRWKKPATIAVATWRRHRFAALQPSPTGDKHTLADSAYHNSAGQLTEPVPGSRCGVLITKKIKLSGSKLHVNVIVGGTTSRMVVSVLRPDMCVHFQGFGQKEAVVFESGTDSLYAQASWLGSDLRELRGEIVQLMFSLCGDARLFAFTIDR